MDSRERISEGMDARKIVVVVEDVEAARTALRWALHNLLRYGDLITLLHVFPTTKSRSKKKLRIRRLKGFQLALSFKEICNSFPNAKIEILVREGDQDGGTLVALVREIGASTLVVGLHDRSFLYRLGMGQSNVAISNLNCKVLAIKEPTTPTLTTRRTRRRSSSLDHLLIRLPADSSTNLDFSQVEIASSPRECAVSSPPRIPYRICPDPSAIIWRSRKSRRRRSNS